MVFPVVTAVYAGILALIFAGLSVWVIAGRFRFRINHGDGGEESLNRRIRAHANFAEYVPLILLLVGSLEASGTSPVIVHGLLLILVVARIMHPIGMVAPEDSTRQFAFRAPGAVATMAILVIAALMLLARFL